MPILHEPKVFTKENPCTKVDIHNCFYDPVLGRYQRRAVVEARGVIGLNTPKYLLREGYAVYRSEANVEYYELTPPGVDWLRKGLEAHLQRHPDDRSKLVTMSYGSRRTRTVKPH